MENNKNEGKSKTIVDGNRITRGEYILMIDGDLIGLKKENILDLVTPVINNQVDITISHRGNTPTWWIRYFRIETFSGERCFSRNFLLSYTDTIAKLPGYGLEVFMNEKIVENKLRIKSVPMNNVRIDFKWHKHGLLVGVWKELLMWRNIFSVVGPKKLISQILGMKKLVVF
jgi:glycosyltransferase involved in cell wall biosynthesis